VSRVADDANSVLSTQHTAPSHCNERFIERILPFDFLLFDERIVKDTRDI